MKSQLKLFLGYVFWGIHNFISVILFIYSLFTTNYFGLMLILLLFIFVIISWYFFNCCMAVPVENWFFGKKDNTVWKNFEKFASFDYFGEKIVVFDNVYKNRITYYNICFILFLIFKMYYLYEKQRKRADECEKKLSEISNPNKSQEEQLLTPENTILIPK